MLARSTYDQQQIATARTAFAEVLAQWRAVAAASSGAARREAEAQVFAQMVVAMDGWFVHRARAVEGKNGNPLNEVRLLAEGITANGGRFPAVGPIRWHAAASVTGLDVGDPILLTETLFARLAEAFMDEMAARFSG